MNRRLLLESLLESKPQLATPVISLNNDNLIIEEVENAEYYDIYVDGVLEHTIDNRPITLISFTIEDNGIEIDYQAEDGMTWAEWIVSEYNTDGFYVDNHYVYNSDGSILTYNQSAIRDILPIVNHEIYTVIGGSGSNN